MDNNLTNNNNLSNNNNNNLTNNNNNNNSIDSNNNGVPDWYEVRIDDQSTFPEGDLGRAYTSEEKLAAKIPNYKDYKWYQNPVMDGHVGTRYFYTLGEKIEKSIENNPEETKQALNEIAKEDNGISKKDVQPLIKEAEQVTDGDERTSEVNNEVVDKALENPKLSDLLDNVELLYYNNDEVNDEDIIDKLIFDFEDNSEEIDPEDDIIDESDFKDPFERENKKELKEKTKRIEKDIPIPRIKKKDINDKIINAANEGVGEDELSKIQKAYAEAKKPTKYEKEAAKAAGLIDNESEYNKKSKKEKKEIEKEIDKILEEQKKAADEKRAKEAAKERVKKFFKPLQYERKVYANGRNRVLPKGTFMSPDGTEYYNPETETIEQVIDDSEKKQKKIELPKSNYNYIDGNNDIPSSLGSGVSADISTDVGTGNFQPYNKNVVDNPNVISQVRKAGSFLSGTGTGGGSISAGSVSNFDFDDKSNNTVSETGKGQSIDIEVSKRDANTASLNGANSVKHLDDSLDELGFKDTKHNQEIETKGQIILPNEEFHEKNRESFELKLPENPTNDDIILYLERDSINWENGDSKSKYLPFRFFVRDGELYGTVIGHGKPEKIENFMKHEILARGKISNIVRGK